jgi:hypothetical protein
MGRSGNGRRRSRCGFLTAMIDTPTSAIIPAAHKLPAPAGATRRRRDRRRDRYRGRPPTTTRRQPAQRLRPSARDRQRAPSTPSRNPNVPTDRGQQSHAGPSSVRSGPARSVRAGDGLRTRPSGGPGSVGPLQFGPGANGRKRPRGRYFGVPLSRRGSDSAIYRQFTRVGPRCPGVDRRRSKDRTSAPFRCGPASQWCIATGVTEGSDC